MLSGLDPSTPHEWQLVVNFWAANVALAEPEICSIMSKIFDCPLPESDICKIALFQARAKAKAKKESKS
jgi:hypothetical protein